MNKKGISPLIGTVLLVAIVIAMVLLIMPWITKTIKTQQEKTSAAAQQFDCITDLGLELSVDDAGAVTLDNRGSTDIIQIDWRIYSDTGAVTSATQGDGSTTVVAGYGVEASSDGTAAIVCPVGGRVEAIATLGNGVVCGDMPIELTC